MGADDCCPSKWHRQESAEDWMSVEMAELNDSGLFFHHFSIWLKSMANFCSWARASMPGPKSTSYSPRFTIP